MTIPFEQYCQDFATRCSEQYGGQHIVNFGPEVVPAISGDPSDIEARVEALIMERLPEVTVRAQIDGHNRMNVQITRKVQLY